jgi:hypothetical protein
MQFHKRQPSAMFRNRCEMKNARYSDKLNESLLIEDKAEIAMGCNTIAIRGEGQKQEG